MRIADELVAASKRSYVPPSQIAIIYAGLNEKEKALDWLEKGYQSRDAELTDMKVAPYYNSLRSDPRFQNVLRRMNFPP